MNMTTPSLTRRPAWQALEAHYRQIKERHIRDLFRDDPERGTRLMAQAAGLYMDYSKHRITDETIRCHVNLAVECGLPERRAAMFNSKKINITENRAVLHTTLRAAKDAHIYVDGRNAVPDVHTVLDKMADLAEQERSGARIIRPGRSNGASRAPTGNTHSTS